MSVRYPQSVASTALETCVSEPRANLGPIFDQFIESTSFHLFIACYQMFWSSCVLFKLIRICCCYSWKPSGKG